MEANEIILLIQGNVPLKPAALGNHGAHGAADSAEQEKFRKWCKIGSSCREQSSLKCLDIWITNTNAYEMHGVQAAGS